jgi:chorismate mutase
MVLACRGVRGATTSNENTKTAIFEATQELLANVIESNAIEFEDMAAIFLTTSPNLNADFPAVAARALGLTEVALLCGHEMDVPDGLKNCIRVLILINTDKKQEDLNHVYLRGAVDLRNRGASSGA